MKKLSVIVTLFILLLSTACTKQDYVFVLPAPVKIAVAPFNQPTSDSQLLAGYIPSEQSHATQMEMAKYDELLKKALQATNRNFIFLTEKDLAISIQKDEKNRPNVLATWAKLAQNAGTDYIIVPQILEHQEKQGKDRDVFMPARLITDYYLIKATHPDTNSTDGFLQARSHYKEISFIDVNVQGEDYITPRQHKNIIEFVKESIYRMIREFHLNAN